MYLLNDNKKIPNVLFGTYLINDETSVEECLDKAISSGYRGIDTASVYRNEAFIGKVLKTILPKYGLKREDIFITSKLAPGDQGYENAKSAIRNTLDNLQLEHLDLYLIHWPGTSKIDLESPAQLENRKGSWKALEEAKESGLIRSIGVSNYMIKHLQEMKQYASIIPAVNQVECHPFLNQHELVQYCQTQHIHFQAYSSLGSTTHHMKLIDNETVQKVSKDLNKSPAQILLKWATNQGFSVLPKSTNPNHIATNIQLFDWEMTDQHMQQLFDMNKDERFCWNPHTVA